MEPLAVVAVLSALLCVSTKSVCEPIIARTDGPVLARVDLTGPVENLGLPVYACSQDAAGRDYAIVASDETDLIQTRCPYTVLDPDAHPEKYVLARPMRTDARAAAGDRFSVVHDDGVQWVVRATAEDAEALSELGFAIQRLSATPMVLAPRYSGVLRFGPRLAVETTTGFAFDARIAQMISCVRESDLYTALSRLTGEEAAIMGGDLYAIPSRHTYSGTPITRATQYAYEQMQALGLDVRYHTWASGRNVVGTQVGGALADEIVVVVAHLDNMPSGDRAPGADDNGSGSISVLTAAAILRPYTFDRTIRFLLVTGEEQGLLGSAAYATDAYNAGDNIVAVFNMDMIAWDSDDDRRLHLYTRSSGSAYSNDFAIASVFTNIVSIYGLDGDLAPVIISNGMGSSDHVSFWNKSFPAITAIEAYGVDFNAYYHTLNDNLAHCNMAYYTAFVKASVGTVAHLADPVDHTPVDVIEVANGDWTPGSGIGAGVFYARHEPGATESGADGRDEAWTNAYTNANPSWLKISTAPDNTDLRIDSRPISSETSFHATLSVTATNGTTVSCTNRLRFAFLTSPDSNRVYTARIHIDGLYTVQSNDFNAVMNLHDVVAGGGYVDLPSLAQVSNGVAYGTCDIDVRFLDTVGQQVLATHSCEGYYSPGTGTVVTCEFSYPTNRTLLSLLWSPVLPTGWTLGAASGNGSPEIAAGEIVFNGTLTSNPVAFTYQVSVPGNQPVTNPVGGTAGFQLAGMAGTASVDATPVPLVVPRYHSADYQAPLWVIDGTEINRVLSYWRAGGYHIDPAGYDGYAPTDAPDIGGPTNSLHSADYQSAYWVIDGDEVNDALAFWRANGYNASGTGTNGYSPALFSTGERHTDGYASSDLQVTATHSTGPTYNPGGLLVVSNTLTFDTIVYSLGWEPHVPRGWQLVSVEGDGDPEFRRGDIVWTGELPPSPVHMTYTLAVPLWEVEDHDFGAETRIHFGNEVNATTRDCLPTLLTVRAQDSDGDGMPDGWEQHYSGGATNMIAALDDDHDGMSNLAECLAGTDPLNTNSLLRLTMNASDLDLLLQWSSETSRIYSVLLGTNLPGEFLPLATGILASPPFNTYTDAPSANRAGFYRIRLDEP